MIELEPDVTQLRRDTRALSYVIAVVYTLGLVANFYGVTAPADVILALGVTIALWRALAITAELRSRELAGRDPRHDE